jgi:hypothetical protein
MISMIKKLVSYCGLCCADCHGFRGKTADLARDLRKELRETKFKSFAAFAGRTSFGKVFKDFDKCYEVLGGMVKFRCRHGCRNGGGNPYCKIRNCAIKKSYDGCWLCDEYEKCEKLEFLTEVHKDAHLKNIKIIRKKGIEGFLDGKRNW